jgi:tripartite-type tricarboxylate transporter receptor subunit TctC
MRINLLRSLRLIAGAALTVCLAAPALAQSYPDKPIRLMAPFPAGGLADVLARAVGDELSKSLGQPVIVENRTGAGGNIGADAVARAEPDGYTLLMSSAGILSINQFLYKSMPFDPATAFAPVSLVADMPMLLVVHPKVGVQSVKEFVDLARAQPGKLNFGSPGIGTTGHLGLALFMHVANVKLTHVPYRGAAPSVQDLVAGQIDGVFDNPPTVISHIKAGSIRALGVAAKERMALLPDVPTIIEGGVAGYEASSWFGVVAPANTPPAIVKRLSEEIAKAVRQPSMQRFTTQSGARLVGDTPEQFAQFIREERAKWGEIVKAAGITAE